MEEQEKYRFKWWGLLGVSLLAFTSFLDTTIVNTAIPFIKEALKADILQLQWVMNIFSLVLSMTMIVTGKLADLWGRKRIFYCGVAIFAVAATGAGLSRTIEMLIFFRGLQGLAASTVFISSAALLSDIFPAEERVRAISIYGGFTGFGLMIGPFLGGVLIGFFNWRWVFWVNLPIIALGFAACSFSLRGHSPQNDRVKIDWVSLLLLIFGLGALMYGIIGGAESEWSSPVAWTFLGAGLTSLIFLVIFDRLRENPLLDLGIFKENLITLAALSCALAGVVSTVFMFFDPLYLRLLRRLSPFVIGALVAVIPAAQAILSFVFSCLVKRFGVANLLTVSILAAFCAVFLHRFIEANTSLYFLIAPFLLLGVNWGLSNAGVITSVNQVIQPEKIASAVGTVATIWNIVGALMLASSTAIFHAVEKGSSFLPAFHMAINFNILFAGLVLIAGIWMRTRLKIKQV